MKNTRKNATATVIAGGGGFLGARTALLGQRAGRGVVALVRPSTDCWRLPASVTRVSANLNDVQATKRQFEAVAPTHVVNCVSAAGHTQAGTDTVAAWQDTVLATVELLEACRSLALERFVHVSSSLVYGNSQHPHQETDPLEPLTARGAMKLAAETAVRQWGKETNTPTTILRPFSIYGPFEARHRLIPALLEALRTGAEFSMTKESYPRDFVFVDDVAAAILTCLDRSDGDIEGDTFNLGTGTQTSTQELANLAEQITGRSLTKSNHPFAPRPSDRPHWRANSSRAHEQLGWTCRSLAEGLEATWLEEKWFEEKESRLP